MRVMSQSSCLHGTLANTENVKIGEMLEIAEGTTVAAFLKEHGYPDKMIAVECNGAIIPRSIWEEAILKDGDTVEVVRFVGGG